MKARFIETPNFKKSVEQFGGDDWLRAVQLELLTDVYRGSVIKSSGGFRKLRARVTGGKRGGARVIYLNVPTKQAIYLVLAYPKSAQDTLSPEALKQLRRLANRIKGE